MFKFRPSEAVDVCPPGARQRDTSRPIVIDCLCHQQPRSTNCFESDLITDKYGSIMKFTALALLLACVLGAASAQTTTYSLMLVGMALTCTGRGYARCTASERLALR